jgi:hypothetical protein
VAEPSEDVAGLPAEAATSELVRSLDPLDEADRDDELEVRDMGAMTCLVGWWGWEATTKCQEGHWLDSSSQLPHALGLPCHIDSGLNSEWPLRSGGFSFRLPLPNLHTPTVALPQTAASIRPALPLHAEFCSLPLESSHLGQYLSPPCRRPAGPSASLRLQAIASKPSPKGTLLPLKTLPPNECTKSVSRCCGTSCRRKNGWPVLSVRAETRSKDLSVAIMSDLPARDKGRPSVDDRLVSLSSLPPRPLHPQAVLRPYLPV